VRCRVANQSSYQYSTRTTPSRPLVDAKTTTRSRSIRSPSSRSTTHLACDSSPGTVRAGRESLALIDRSHLVVCYPPRARCCCRSDHDRPPIPHRSKHRICFRASTCVSIERRTRLPPRHPGPRQSCGLTNELASRDVGEPRREPVHRAAILAAIPQHPRHTKDPAGVGAEG